MYVVSKYITFDKIEHLSQEKALHHLESQFESLIMEISLAMFKAHTQQMHKIALNMDMEYSRAYIESNLDKFLLLAKLKEDMLIKRGNDND